MDRYLNVVREGSVVRDPWAFNMDTGAELPLATLSGQAAVDRGALSAAQAAAGSEVVMISFPAITANTSTRLRIHETYVDPNRYARVGDELVWDRNFGRAMNRVVLAAWLVPDPLGYPRIDHHRGRWPTGVDLLEPAPRWDPGLPAGAGARGAGGTLADG